jgi:uncharacterized membrane protein
MNWFKPQSLLDKTYEIGIIIKGIDGTIELLAGFAILLLSPHAITSLTHFFDNVLSFDGNLNIITAHIEKTGGSLASGHTLFAAAFLITHGLVKVVLVTCLLLNKLWAYPWALVILSIFTIYQGHLLVTKPTFGMLFLTVLDVAIIYLIYREWQQVRHKSTPATSP